MPIRVVAHLTAKSGTVEQTRDLLMSLIEKTRAENGCITYELMQNNDDPTDFTFVEEWTSEDTLERHASSEHIGRCRSEILDHIDGGPDIRVYRLVG